MQKLSKTIFVMAWLAILLLSSSLYAETVLEGKSVKKSKYYTGNTGAARVEYITLKEWLAYRSNDEMPKDIYSRGFIVDDRAVVKPLYDVANRLLQHWPGTVPKLAIFVRADMASSNYGGEALMANEILIFKGTLQNMESDDELAGILAHELAHVLLGHNKKVSHLRTAIQLFEDYQNTKNLVKTIESGDVVETADQKFRLEFDPKLVNELAKVQEQKERATTVYRAFHGSMLGQPAESKADLLAADLLIKAGYSPLGLKDNFDRLANSYTIEKYVNKLLSDAAKQTLVAVELEMNEQIAKFQSEIEASAKNGTAKVGNPLSSFSFSNFSTGLKSRMKKSFTDYAIKRFKSAHPVPEKRIVKLAKYLDENYGIRERQRPRTDGFIRQFRRSGLVKIRHYEKLETAKVAMVQGDLNTAARVGLSSLVSKHDGDPYKRYTTHRIRKSQNKLNSAVANVELINNVDSVPTQAVVEMVDLLVERKRLKSAQKIVTEKEQYGYTVPELYPSKISIALASEDQEKAVAYAQQCVSTKKINKTTKEQCQSFGLLSNQSAGSLLGNALNSTSSSIGGAFTSLTGKKEK